MKTLKRREQAQSQTKLGPAEMERVQKLVIAFLNENPPIRNQTLREISGIGYDQAIHFFREMLLRGVLQKEGVGAGTRYLLATGARSSTPEG